jgi:deoxyribodipyrimidine photo-lyase
MPSKQEIAVFWFRRDLRLDDNAGLFHALSGPLPVLPVFIFDEDILSRLEDKKDRRVSFIHFFLEKMHLKLKSAVSGIFFFHGKPKDAFLQLTSQFDVKKVYTNHDYEPYAQSRDHEIAELLSEKGIAFQSFKDQVIFEKDEILSDSGMPYTVFTPYSKKWKSRFSADMVKPYTTGPLMGRFLQWDAPEILSLQQMGFQHSGDAFPDPSVTAELLKNYGEKRNFPALPATSRLSIHLRFGTVSIRHLVSLGYQYSESWLNELIWREFYMNILWHFPRVGEGKSFKPAYEKIEWRRDPENFQKWCEGKTGYPIVDAGMRELNATGFMHNRVRMITASFLVKHLLIDWRLGEAYFAKKLLDFDLSANNGGWQWASGSGCDAAPYFRVFNPTLQTEKFDKEWLYIKKWVPEWNNPAYLNSRIVNHEFARKRVLDAYKKALKPGE